MAPAQGKLLASSRPVRQVLDVASKQARKLQRNSLGRLSDNVVRPATLKRYDTACLLFFRHLRNENVELPSDHSALDSVVCAYIEVLWQEGESKSLAGDLLSGLQHHTPALKGWLNGGWRLHGAWSKLELPARALPISPLMAQALAGKALLMHWKDVCILILVGFHTLMRTGELCTLQKRQCQMLSPDLMVIVLEDTKSGQRAGIVERVTVTDARLIKALDKYLASLEPGDTLLRRTPAQFRVCFQQCRDALKLDKAVMPYSLRRGGATADFRHHGQIDKTADRGRWGNTKTARIYINTALAEQAATVSPEVSKRLNEAAGILHRLC
jgi:hypothetical protein